MATQIHPNRRERQTKVLCDFKIRTDRVITARKPDMVIVDKETQKGLITDVTIPNDSNIVQKENEKVDN